LLQRFPDNDDPESPLLFVAAKADNPEAVRALLAARSPEYVNQRDSRGRTALCYTANAEVVRILLDASPDMATVRDDEGRSALAYLAFSSSFPEALKELLRHCEGRGVEIDINEKDFNGDSALHLSMVEGSIRVVKMLLEKGADVLGCGFEGTTVLMKQFMDSDVYEDLTLLECLARCGDKSGSILLQEVLDAVLLHGGSGVARARGGVVRAAEAVEEPAAKRQKVE
jgi:ankyrin repeat protein